MQVRIKEFQNLLDTVDSQGEINPPDVIFLPRADMQNLLNDSIIDLVEQINVLRKPKGIRAYCCMLVLINYWRNYLKKLYLYYDILVSSNILTIDMTSTTD